MSKEKKQPFPYFELVREQQRMIRGGDDDSEDKDKCACDGDSGGPLGP